MEKKRIAFILPHPDDEALALGLPKELTLRGHDVDLISLTTGDLGSHVLTSRRHIASIRKKEFAAAGEALGAHTTLLGFHDGNLPHVRQKAQIRLLAMLRDIQPDIVITANRDDYHDDHIATHEIARWATFHLADKPLQTRRGTRDVPAVGKPVSFYSMDTQGSQQRLNIKEDDGIATDALYPVNMIVSIGSDALEKSIAAFAEHKSQLTERPDGKTGYVELARRGARRRGQQAGFMYGAGLVFEPFGGYAFSTENMLSEIFPKESVVLLS